MDFMWSSHVGCHRQRFIGNLVFVSDYRHDLSTGVLLPAYRIRIYIYASVCNHLLVCLIISAKLLLLEPCGWSR